MSRRVPIALLAATVGLTAAAPAANAAIYMRVDGIKGTVTAPGHEKPVQIELENAIVSSYSLSGHGGG